VRTRVGYAGGKKANPTYTSLGDHTETIEIDYDPTRISYDELLAVFWDSHSATATPWSRQYASRLFYHSEAQRERAEASLKAEEARGGKRIHTTIEPYETFYRAEDYHQKYQLRYQTDLIGELQAIYPVVDDLVDSTVAARLNGYVVGYGSLAVLEAELDDYGLSAEGQEAVRKLGKRLAP